MRSGPQGYEGPGGYAGSNKTEQLRVEPPSFAWLVIAEGIHAGRIFRLHSDSTLVGRDSACDIVLDDTAASRQHVKIRVEEEEDEKVYILHDLASENGTVVNGEEVVKHDLADGDRVNIGRTKLVFKQIQV
jgi:pSer/pThr/pTyr-binding forkhead associated (FHA) protein